MKRNDLQEALPASEVIRKVNAKKRKIQETAAKLPKLPDRIEKQLLQEAGFPG